MEFPMRFLCAFVCLSLLPLTASAQDKKEVGPLKEVPLNLKEPVPYEKVDVIFHKRCTVCHSGKEPDSKFEINTYAKLMKGGKRGEAVKPGKSQDSLLYKAMMRTHKPFMPPRTEEPATPEEVALIKLWID